MEKKSLNEDYICPLCQEIFEYPFQMNNCTHIYCRKCIHTLQKYSILKPNYVSETFFFSQINLELKSNYLPNVFESF